MASERQILHFPRVHFPKPRKTVLYFTAFVGIATGVVFAADKSGVLATGTKLDDEGGNRITAPFAPPEPTATPVPTLTVTPEPTFTPTPEPSFTPVPRIEPTAAPRIVVPPTIVPTRIPPTEVVVFVDHPDDARAGVLASLINQYRAEKGLKPYSPNASLTNAAKDWAKVMAQNKWNAHEGPDGSTVTSRIEKAGYKNWETYTENYVFSNAPTEQSAWNAVQMMDWWKNSLSHNANMLSSTFTEYGNGCYAAKLTDGLVWVYCVTVFAKPKQ